MTDDRDEIDPDDAPFQWRLTPGGADEADPPEPEPTAPFVPPPLVPASLPITPRPPTAPFVPPSGPDVPTAAFAFEPETTLPPSGLGVPTAAFAFEPPTRALPHAAPLDSSLDGVTEALNAQAVGLPDPVDEGLEASPIDALFGETQFREYADEPLLAPPSRPSSELVRVESPTTPAGRGITRTQKGLLWVAGGLVAALALVALFVLGTRLSFLFGPPAAVVASASPSPSPSASPTALALGPVAPGEYRWDQLLGGECLDPFESAWQDSYTVVDCAVPHPAQLVYRGVFSDAADVPYPGVDALQQQITLLCTAPTIIDYAAAAATVDIQVSAGFPADEADWTGGNRAYFCFVNRSGGEPIGVSIAVPQVAPAVPVPAAPAP